MMFYYLDITSIYGTQRHIFTRLPDGGVISFPLADENPNKAAYDAWVAEGNTAEEWTGE